jgi:bifunctional DNA-binding transcriptional regulator/antitoxin component of YhaV-PrlF toxin-antitoxin module
MPTKRNEGANSGATLEAAATEVKVISGGRITLPEAIRSEYGLAAGSRVTLVRQPAGWLITKAVATSLVFKTSDGVELTAALPH